MREAETRARELKKKLRGRIILELLGEMRAVIGRDLTLVNEDSHSHIQNAQGVVNEAYLSEVASMYTQAVADDFSFISTSECTDGGSCFCEYLR